MVIIKCKMCGGDLEIQEGQNIGVCQYCGSTMTLPKISDDQRAAAFNRGNHFRRIGEFDKALQVYERIVREDENDAEAHWCCALCRFGIEYVEDPTTYEWIPTCHRASFDNFLEDVDYLATVEHSDGITRRQYQKDGAKIAEVQRGILATSQNEEPYDVFICYKETNENGDRTRDSTMAQDIYYQLTEQGRRVFFARITLEDKVGAEYEPYIFAALHSAKVMVVVGTSAENLNAVWVKNEWSRFLSMMKHDRNKLLLPCYRDMDPYDLPDQLGVLQSYDMSKIGFIQDLTRGISKVLDVGKGRETVTESMVVQKTGGSNTDALLKRGYMALEDQEWKKANEFFEDVLNQNAECADAYFGKFLVEECAVSLEDLIKKRLNLTKHVDSKIYYLPENCEHVDEIARLYTIEKYLPEKNIRSCYNFDRSYPSFVAGRRKQFSDEQNHWTGNRNLARALQFASATEKKRIQNAMQTLYDQMEERLQTAIQQEAEVRSQKEKDYRTAQTQADSEIRKLNEVARNTRDREYDAYCQILSESDDIAQLQSAVKKLKEYHGYRDSESKAQKCMEKIAQIEKDRAEKIALVEKEQEYNMCCQILLQSNNVEELQNAATRFKALKDYRDSVNNGQKCIKKAEQAKKNFDKQKILEQQRREKAKKRKNVITIALVTVSLCTILLVIVMTQIIIHNARYSNAIQLLESGKYGEAITEFESLDDYKDSQLRAQELRYEQAENLLESGRYEEAITEFESLDNYEDSQLRAQELRYEQAENLLGSGRYEEAITEFESLGDYEDSQVRVQEVQYVKAEDLLLNGLKRNAAILFGKIRNYEDAWERCFSIWGELTERESISAGEAHTVGLRNDGTVMAVGSNNFQQCEVGDWSDIVAVSAGLLHTVGLRSDGTVVSAGCNDSGQCDVDDWSDIVAVSAGDLHTVGLRSDGTVVAVGKGYSGHRESWNWGAVVAISAGYHRHIVGLLRYGSVVAAGNNEHGECEVDDWRDIVAISTGGLHTVGLQSNGTVVAVGNNDDGQCEVEDWKDIVKISVSVHHTVGLRSDGTVVAVGNNQWGQCKVDDWSDIVAVSAGVHHTVGLRSDGTVVCAGDKYYSWCKDVEDWSDIKISENPLK